MARLFLANALGALAGVIVVLSVYSLFYAGGKNREFSQLGSSYHNLFSAIESEDIVGLMRIGASKALSRSSDVRLAYEIPSVCEVGGSIAESYSPNERVVLAKLVEFKGQKKFFVENSVPASRFRLVCEVPAFANSNGFVITKSAALRRALSGSGVDYSYVGVAN